MLPDTHMKCAGSIPMILVSNSRKIKYLFDKRNFPIKFYIKLHSLYKKIIKLESL